MGLPAPTCEGEATLAQLLEVVDSAPYPAIGVWESRVFSNERARRLLSASSGKLPVQLSQAVTSASVSGRLGFVSLGDKPAIVIPLIESDRGSPAVLVAQVAVEDLPRVYGDFQGRLISWTSLAHGLPDMVLAARPDGRIDFWNRNFVKYTGTNSAPSFGQFEAMIDARDLATFTREWHAGLRNRKRFAIHLRLARKDGVRRWHRLHAQPIIRDEKYVVKWLLTLSDIDDEVEARNRAEASQRSMRFLADAGRVLAESLDPAQIAEAACRHACTLADEAAIELNAPGAKQLIAFPKSNRAAQILASRESETSGEAASSRKLVHVENGSKGQRYIIVRLEARGREIGTMCLTPRTGSDLLFEDIELYEDFGRRVAVALENARLYSRERLNATTLQDMLLPASLYQPYGIRIDSAYVPGDDEARVGGDWYDAFELRNGALAISIGDVAGHGTQAAAIMGAVRQTIRTALLSGSSPSRALTLANDVVYSNDPGFATAFVGVIDTIEMTMECATAGHPSPIATTEDGSAGSLDVKGAALGIAADLDLRDVSAKLPSTGALILYTDGMIEYCRDGIAGLERLTELCSVWARDGMRSSAAQVASLILADAPLMDDAALLVVRFAPIREVDMTFPAAPNQAAIARRALARFAREWMPDEERKGNFLAAACEAVNNAIEHSYEDQLGTIRLTAQRSGDGIVVKVEDFGRWKEVASDPDRGHGLLIMEALADEIQLSRGDDGTTVRLTFALDPAQRRGAERKQTPDSKELEISQQR